VGRDTPSSRRPKTSKPAIRWRSLDVRVRCRGHGSGQHGHPPTTHVRARVGRLTIGSMAWMTACRNDGRRTRSRTLPASAVSSGRVASRGSGRAGGPDLENSCTCIHPTVRPTMRGETACHGGTDRVGDKAIGGAPRVGVCGKRREGRQRGDHGGAGTGRRREQGQRARATRQPLHPPVIHLDRVWTYPPPSATTHARKQHGAAQRIP
jgi:hypothetical protein